MINAVIIFFYSKHLSGFGGKESSARKNLAKYQGKVPEGDQEEVEDESQSLWTGSSSVRQTDSIYHKLKSLNI